MNNPGGRWIDVPPARFSGWIASFGRRHGGEPLVTIAADRASVTFAAPDGAVARCYPPFPPLPEVGKGAGVVGGEAGLLGAEADLAGAVARHASAERVVAVLLVRLGGFAAGVFRGDDLLDAKVGSRLVHGRSAAGGWSQHRFARRREKQAAEALHAAADAAVRVFGQAGRLDAVVLGGDKRTVAGLRDDRRLAPYLDLATDRFLVVPDPKRSVLAGAPRLFLAIKIWLTDEPAVRLSACYHSLYDGDPRAGGEVCPASVDKSSYVCSAGVVKS